MCQSLNAASAATAASPSCKSLSSGRLRISNIKDAYDSWKLMQENSGVHDLISVLARNRKNFGGDLVIGWLQRDESAEALVDLLTTYKT